MMLDSVSVSILISVFPIVLVFIAWYMLRKSRSKKEVWLVLGFLSMIAVYVFLPDPHIVQRLYVEQNDYTSLAYYSGLAAAFLFVALYFFRKHMEDGT